MNSLQKKRRLRFTQKLVLTLLASSLGIAGMPSIVLAQTYIPPDRGLPGRREGGGTRGICITSQPNLTALIPKTNFGLTTQAHPTLFWYVPTTAATLIEFELRNEQNEIIFTDQMPTPETAGIIPVHLPRSEQTTLEPGKLYHWYFTLVCDPQDRSGDVITEGWIERSLPDADMTRQLEAATAEERALLYAKAGIWYDALSTLADLQVAQPDQPAPASWSDLLSEADLQTLTDKPLIPYCPNR